MARILIIDDDEMMCAMISQMVERVGYRADSAYTLADGMEKVFAGSYDVVFLDIRLPDGNGLSRLADIKDAPSAPDVIIITGSEDPDGAELAIKNGAWDYVQKPASIKEMTLPFLRALQYRDEKNARRPLVSINREGIIGNSPQMKYCLDLLAQAAGSEVNVLLTGETGTGKDLFAQAIHANGLRSERNFVIVDCTALPETLVESVLFGYEKGAFTGADRAREGLIKQADGGTLFLDEIGELPLPIQKSFLRVIQEQRFRPIGSKREEKSDFRLIAATNRDLDQMVRNGQFREDLLFRVRSFTIELPPLRDHLEDVKDISTYYMAKLCDRHGIGTKGFSPDFFETLSLYSWPGNVRELIHILERAFTVAQHEPTLFPQHLPKHIRIQVARSSIGKDPREQIDLREIKSSPEELPTIKEIRENAVAEAEQGYLQILMSLTDGNIKEACNISGLSRPRLYALLKKYHITKFT